MKKILKITLSILTLTLVVFSCTEDSSTISNPDVPYSQTIIEDNISVEINSIEPTSNIYALEFKVKNIENNKTLPTIVHKIRPYDKNISIEDVKKNIESFSGVFTIEIDGQILREIIVENGVIKELKSNKYIATVEGKSVFSSEASRTIFGCIDEALEEMNWIEYGSCAISAPACYATLYASCAWDIWA